MFKVKCEKVLPPECRNCCKGLAYDGSWFYLTAAHACKIICVDSDLCPKRSFETRQQYLSLCYDPLQQCFWAASDARFPILYRLNDQFEELERILLHTPEEGGGAITGISYDFDNNLLMVSFAWGIVQLDPNNPKECIPFKKIPGEWIMGVLSLPPYTLCRCVGARGQMMRLYSAEKKLLGEARIPSGLVMEAATNVPCAGGSARRDFYVLLSQCDGELHLLDCVLTPEEPCVCGGTDGAGFGGCKPPCNNCCNGCGNCNNGCGCPKPCDCKRSCCEVLESIALVECSIAHILNAEGEKLQKTLACSDDICKILEANDSVRKTIERMTYLEYLLCNKIEAVKKLCTTCESNCCCKKCCRTDCDCGADINCTEGSSKCFTL